MSRETENGKYNVGILQPKQLSAHEFTNHRKCAVNILVVAKPTSALLVAGFIRSSDQDLSVQDPQVHVVQIFGEPNGSKIKLVDQSSTMHQ